MTEKIAATKKLAQELRKPGARRLLDLVNVSPIAMKGIVKALAPDDVITFEGDWTRLVDLRTGRITYIAQGDGAKIKIDHANKPDQEHTYRKGETIVFDGSVVHL